MRFYAVADPHGFCTHLIEALTNAGYFDDDGEKKLVLCGDALDRGNEAVMMAEFLEGELDAGRLIYILGNHEELLQKQGRYYELYMTQFAGNKI